MSETNKNDSNSDQPAAPSGGLVKKLIPLGVVGAALIAFFATGSHKYFAPDQLFATLEGLRGWIEANKLLAVLAFIGIYAGLVAISFQIGRAHV